MVSQSDFTPFLKQFWTPLRKEATRYKKHPFLGMVRKNTSVGGDNCNIPIDVDDGAEGSADFTTAQTIAKNTSSFKKKFQFDWVESFQLARVRNGVLRQSRRVPEQALMSAAKETEKAQKILMRKLGRAIYRTGYGEKGVIDTTTTLTTKIIILATASDARFFKIGDQLQFSSSLSGATLRDSGDFISVTGIDVDAGKITTDCPTDLQTSITGIATGDTIFARGDRQNSATPTRLLMPGLGAWIPDTAPTAGDAFGTNSVDRSVWVSRLAGLRFPAAGTQAGPVEEILLKALAQCGDQEADVDTIFCAPGIYSDLLVALEGRKGYGPAQGKVWEGTIGYNGFQIDAGLSNPVKIFRDGDCPAKRAYALNMETWELQSLGETVQNDLEANGKDGEAGRDIEDNSGMEWRYVFHGHLACLDPGQNMAIKFA
jgi:hypothetical protein